MYGRWFNIAVILLWLSTMGWLISQKVLPPLLVGDPPSYRTILLARDLDPPVGWSLHWNSIQIGWALSDTERQPHGLTEINSHVHFDDLPLEEMTPGWLRFFVKLLDKPHSNLTMDVKSTLTIDPLGRLSRLDSVAEFASLSEAIKLQATVDGSELQLNVRSGEFSYSTEIPIQSNTLLSDSLSPQAMLPGLRTGQTWNVRSFSPLLPRRDPVEMLQATVHDMQTIAWNGQAECTWLVVYHTAHGVGLSSANSPRSRLWVRPDGTVLRQQRVFFDSVMTFVRLPDKEAAELARRVELGGDAE